MLMENNFKCQFFVFGCCSINNFSFQVQVPKKNQHLHKEKLDAFPWGSCQDESGGGKASLEFVVFISVHIKKSVRSFSQNISLETIQRGFHIS